MHEIQGGGYIIDTPGIREFGTIDFDTYEVSHFFPEIFKTGGACQFNNYQITKLPEKILVA